MFSTIRRSPNFLLLIFSGILLSLLGICLKPKMAIGEGIMQTFTVTMSEAMSWQSMYSQSEQKVEQYIQAQFSQNPDLSHLRLTVLGEKSVEIVPILSVYVTREQWQNQPQLAVWATYHPVAYALLFDDQKPWQVQQRAASPATQPINRETSTFLNNAIEPSAEEIRLNPQAYLDEMD